jgi:hypothetical protein
VTADSGEPAPPGRSAPVREPNVLLRQARLRRPSPSNSTRSMSQRELAEAVTAYVFRTTPRQVPLDRHDISRWERTRRQPIAVYRTALRAVLGVAADAELGFDDRGAPAAPSAARRRTAPPADTRPTYDPRQIRKVPQVKVETIRFATRDEDEAYFYRAMHHLASGCVQMGAREKALTALLEVVTTAVRERQSPSSL